MSVVEGRIELGEWRIGLLLGQRSLVEVWAFLTLLTCYDWEMGMLKLDVFMFNRC